LFDSFKILRERVNTRSREKRLTESKSDNAGKRWLNFIKPSSCSPNESPTKRSIGERAYFGPQNKEIESALAVHGSDSLDRISTQCAELAMIPFRT